MLTPSQEQVLSRQSHTAIIANAGSGKTRVLVEQYIKLLLDDASLSPRDIVTITFSEQSAKDIKKKIREAIHERIIKEEKQGVLQRLCQIQDRMQGAVITTIHSFCAQILRLYPVESKTDSAFGIVTSPEDQLLQEECVQQTLYEVLSDGYQLGGSAAIDFVKKYGRHQITRLLLSLFTKRFSIYSLQQVFAEKDNSQIANWWLSLIEEVLHNQMLAHFDLSYYYELLVYLSKNTRPNAEILLEEYNNALTLQSRVAAVTKILTYFHTKTWDKINGNRFRKVKDELTANLPGWLFAIPNYQLLAIAYASTENIHFQLEQVSVDSRQAIDLFLRTLGTYAERKEHYSLVDFDDMLWKAYELLERPEIRSELSARYSYILVDEYQDTDDLQYNIIRSLTANFTAGNRLIIVGDPKQSIYSFRNANIALFTKTTEEITESTNLQAIELKESFRMLATPMAFINKLFASVFTDNGAIPYNELVLGRTDDSQGSVEILIHRNDALKSGSDNDDNEDEDEIVITREPEMIAARIAQMVDEACEDKISEDNKLRKITFRDIGILIRSRTHLEKLESALRSYKIPYTSYGGRGFYTSQEIIDIIAYLAFLVNQKDDVALYGTLRSPYFNLSDTTLFEIANQQGIAKGTSLWERFCKYLDSHDVHYHMQRAYDQLRENLELVGKLTSTRLIEKIYTETMILGIYELYPHSKQKIANLQKFADISLSFHSSGFQSTFDFLERVMLLSQREEEEALGESLDDINAVHIMTIHRSKGLEFPVVFLPFLQTKILGGDARTTNFKLENGIGLTINDPESKHPALLAEYFSLQANERATEEAKRILYVGATRVREHLILSASIKGDTIPKKSYIEWIADAFTTSFTSDITYHDSLKKYDNIAKQTNDNSVEITIPIINSISYEQSQSPKEEKNEPALPKIINTLRIPYEEGLTRYSPSQLLVYKECPTKYHLRFNLGIPEDSRLSFNFEAADSAEMLRGTLVGQLVHGMFQHVDSIVKDGSIHDDLFRRNLGVLLETLGLNTENSIERYSEIVRAHIVTFISSEYGKYILSLPTYFTELSLRVKLNSKQILSGVIDRVYHDADGWHILDYKTDRLINNPVKDERYRFQLLFYSYLLKKLYDIETDIHAHLFYSKYEVEKNYSFSTTDFYSIESMLTTSVAEILADKRAPSLSVIHKNRDHCKECAYYYEQTNLCLVEI